MPCWLSRFDFLLDGATVFAFKLLLFLLFFLFLGGQRELTGLDLGLGHLDLAVETDVVAMREEQMLVVVSVPVVF